MLRNLGKKDQSKQKEKSSNSKIEKAKFCWYFTSKILHQNIFSNIKLIITSYL